jgi:hypothetical protein
MAGTNFNILSKPPPDGDVRGWYRWFYRITEILNGLVHIPLQHVNLVDVLQSDDTSTDTTGGKHVTDAQVKKYEDHRLTTGNPHGTTYIEVGAEPANANIQSHIGTVSGNPHGTAIDTLTDTYVVGKTYGDVLTWNSTSGKYETGRKIGNGTDFTQFEADGTMVSVGAATVWNDIFIDGLSAIGGATDPPLFGAFLGGVWATSFSATAINSAHASFELQHDYKEGTDLEIHMHWSPATTNVGNVVWGIEYTSANRLGVFPATTTVRTTVAAGGVANTHNSQNLVILSGTGVGIGHIIRFRLFRDGTNAADTFTGAAFLHRIGIHYECDTLGSRQTTVK